MKKLEIQFERICESVILQRILQSIKHLKSHGIYEISIPVCMGN